MDQAKVKAINKLISAPLTAGDAALIERLAGEHQITAGNNQYYLDGQSIGDNPSVFRLLQLGVLFMLPGRTQVVLQLSPSIEAILAKIGDKLCTLNDI
jgi:hypothetical protein